MDKDILNWLTPIFTRIILKASHPIFLLFIQNALEISGGACILLNVMKKSFIDEPIYSEINSNCYHLNHILVALSFKV